MAFRTLENPCLYSETLFQRHQSLTQANPIRVVQIEIWSLEWVAEESGCSGRWVTFVADLHGKRPWRMLRYQCGPWSSYLCSSAFPLILWDTHSILPINFPLTQARQNPFQMPTGLKKNVITNMSMSLKNFLFGFLNWPGFVPTVSKRKYMVTVA